MKLENFDPAKVWLIIRQLITVAIALGAHFLADIPLEELAALWALIFGTDVSTTLAMRRSTFKPASALQLAHVSFEQDGGPSSFIYDLVAQSVPPRKLPHGLLAVAPIAREYANAALLDDNIRARVQREVHSALRAAGLLKGRSIGVSNLTLVLLLALALSACVPALNTLTGDDASLSYAPNGIVFDAGSSPALDVLVDVQGLELVTTDERCTVYEGGLDCRLGDVEGEVLLELSGYDVTALATFYRTIGGRPYQEVLGD